MDAFWGGVLGALVGGGLTLLGVFLTLRKQEERDRKADERLLRDRKHDRLRAAYRDIVAVAEFYPYHASALGLLEVLARRSGDWTQFFEKLQSPARDISESRATLLLEAQEDRAVLGTRADALWAASCLPRLAYQDAYDEGMEHEE